MTQFIQHIRHDWFSAIHLHNLWVRAEHQLMTKKFWVAAAVILGLAAFFTLLVILAHYAPPTHHPYYSPYLF